MIIGLDVGGTHTDAVLLGNGGLVTSVKVPTDTDNLFETLITALARLTENQPKKKIERLVLSTTLATNMVVQKKLPPVAVLVSAGPGIHPWFFRTGDHYYIVQGALDHSGRELEPLDEQEIRSIGEQIRDAGVDCAAVISKFSVRNPAHEEKMASLLAPYVKQVFTGHALSGALNFPRRITTTYLNAAVSAVHTSFFDAVRSSLSEQGLDTDLHILKPDGGNMNVESSADYPAQTILSGPSASVMGALASAPQDKTCLVLDIGGTTTDMAIILNGAPLIAPDGIEIGSYKTLIRALLTRSIGIGGDSVVRLTNGTISIGPERRGVALAHGGPELTITDALCVLGLLEDGDRTRAEAGVADVAQPLGMEVTAAAELIFDQACKSILSAASEMVAEINGRPVYTVHEMFENIEVRPDRILVLGGPAAQFAERLATMFDGDVEPVSHWQVANAIGCALSRTTCEVTVYADTSRGIINTQGAKTISKISRRSELVDVRKIACELVREKALMSGASRDDLQVEVVEESSFTMVRGFSRTGKNIRVCAQIKPGLIRKFAF